jgi:FdhE protein
MSSRITFDLPEGYVEFYKAIESWQNELLFRLKRNTGISKRSDDCILEGIKRPILETRGIDLDPEEYKGAFLELAQLVKKERENIADAMNEIVAVFNCMDFAEIASRIINDDYKFFVELAEEKGLGSELVYFLLDHALRPFLRCYALPYQVSVAQEDFQWEMSICPVCGSPANFSRVRAEDGQRLLFCEHCFTEWRSKYLGCIYCGNTEPNTIKYLVVEGDDAHQLFVCEKCKGYLKTFDERKGRMKTDLFIAGIETVYLDLIAEEEGYTNKTENERNLN